MFNEREVIIGAALQTYNVEGTLQRRLYVTRFWHDWNGKAMLAIDRVNLNALHSMVRNHGNKSVHVPRSQQMSSTDPFFDETIKAKAESIWRKFAKSVKPEAGMGDASYARLAYAAGKVFYMPAAELKRATVQSTDVTVFIACEELFPLVDEAFKKWKLPPTEYTKALQTNTTFEHLHETSKFAGKFPWVSMPLAVSSRLTCAPQELTAYKKVVPWEKHLVRNNLGAVDATPQCEAKCDIN